MSRPRGVRLSRRAEKALDAFDPMNSEHLKSALREVSRNPLLGKKLKGELAALRSFRMGSFRIVYRFSKEWIDVALSPDTHLVFQGYDFAIPDGRGICYLGPWLKPTFDLRNFPSQAAAFEVVKEMLRQFAALLVKLLLAQDMNYLAYLVDGIMKSISLVVVVVWKLYGLIVR